MAVAVVIFGTFRLKRIGIEPKNALRNNTSVPCHNYGNMVATKVEIKTFSTAKSMSSKS